MSPTMDTRMPDDQAQNTLNTTPPAPGLQGANPDPVQRGLDHLQSQGSAAAFAGGPPPDYAPDPHIQRASSGAQAVHYQQVYQGIPIFQATETVQFDPQGTIQATVGSSRSVGPGIPPPPAIPVTAAVQAAARYVATPDPDEYGAHDQFGEPLVPMQVDVSGFMPQIKIPAADQPDSATVLEPGPFGDDIRANLVWFPLGGTLRLGWEIVITMPGPGAAQYHLVVDAGSTEILYCAQAAGHAARVTGNVYRHDPTQARELVSFPGLLPDFDLDVPPGLPVAFPDPWVAADRLEGNCVGVRLVPDGPPFVGSVQAAALTFNPADALSDQQKLLNLFYFNCYIHDFFYLLGFQEADGNFQQDDLGRGGTAIDRVDARIFPGPVRGTASMLTPADGTAPIMSMGLVTSSGRHTALDASVVFHEFTHGVTNRLVGGRQDTHALEAPQSAGMGEGWSDYIACTINRSDVVGAWVVNNANGIRTQRYNRKYRGDFGDLGKGLYTEIHNIGEIWCVTLLELNEEIGARLALQLVVDSLKLAPANPSFLDMRTALLQALDHKLRAEQISAAQHASLTDALWAVFARRGMGPNARCAGATLLDIVADYTIPPRLAPGVAAQPAAPVVAAAPPPARAATTAVTPLPAHAVTPPAAAEPYIQIIAPAGPIRRLTIAVEIDESFKGELQLTVTPRARGNGTGRGAQ